MERLILALLEAIIDSQLPQEQVGFRRKCSTTDQVLKLTDDIEGGFESRKEVGVILVDLTSAYDTVRHRGLMLKLMKLIPNHDMVRFCHGNVTQS